MEREAVRNIVKAVVLFLLGIMLNQANVFAADVGITTQNFPDDAFRDYVKQEFDQDRNGVLSEAEIRSVTKIVTTGNNKGEDYIATNFQGIGYFTELEDLQIEADLLEDPEHQDFGRRLDVQLDLSWNVKLKRLVCRANLIDKLDLSVLPLLEEIRLDTGVAQKQDLSKHVNLKKIYLENGTQFILPEHMPLLEEFGMHWDSISQIKPPEIDFSVFQNLSKLELRGGDYSNRILTLKNLVKLKTLVLILDGNSVSVDLEGCPALERVDVVHINKLNFQGCENIRELILNSKLPKLDVTGLVNLETLECYQLQGSLLDLRNNKKLENARIERCGYKKILFPQKADIQKLSLQENPQLKELDLRGIKIDQLRAGKNGIKSILLSKKGKYNTLFMRNNRLTKLDLRGIKVNHLYADGNQIKTILLSKNIKYNEVSVKNNRLTKLDLRGIKIDRLCADKNQIKTVLLSKSGKYDEILLANNRLTKLDLRGIWVKVVDTKYNKLRSLKVRGNKMLRALYCQKTNLKRWM